MKRPSVTCSLLLAALAAGCGGTAPVSTTEVLAVAREVLPADPADAAWERAPVHTVELLSQDMVEPRLLEPSTPRLDVRAVTDGERIAFLLRWQDATQNDLPRTGSFADACAVQLPRQDEPDVPAPQMGETNRPVEITFWRASWQAAVDGRPDEIGALYPGEAVDHYPFEAPALEPGSPGQRALADQYAPARALGNVMEGPRERPVEDLLAEGPGTLTRLAEQRSEGRGQRVASGWQVVIVRPLPAGLGRGQRTQVAFAVWDGERGEVGARKMRSVWVPLHVQGEA
jgi:hypothetical protein